MLLSLIFAPNKTYPLYAIKDGFTIGYGRDLLWWAVLLLMLAAVILLELGVSSIRKAFWPTDIDLFQELQRDPGVRRRFEESLRREEDGGMVEVEGEEGRGRSVEEQRREVEIQELLDRPRVMDAADLDGVLKSPIEVGDNNGHLSRRKPSLDPNSEVGNAAGIEFEVRDAAGPTTSYSVDAVDGLGRR